MSSTKQMQKFEAAMADAAIADGRVVNAEQFYWQLGEAFSKAASVEDMSFSDVANDTKTRGMRNGKGYSRRTVVLYVDAFEMFDGYEGDNKPLFTDVVAALRSGRIQKVTDAAFSAEIIESITSDGQSVETASKFDSVSEAAKKATAESVLYGTQDQRDKLTELVSQDPEILKEINEKAARKEIERAVSSGIGNPVEIGKPVVKTPEQIVRGVVHDFGKPLNWLADMRDAIVALPSSTSEEASLKEVLAGQFLDCLNTARGYCDEMEEGIAAFLPSAPDDLSGLNG